MNAGDSIVDVNSKKVLVFFKNIVRVKQNSNLKLKTKLYESN